MTVAAPASAPGATRVPAGVADPLPPAMAASAAPAAATAAPTRPFVAVDFSDESQREHWLAERRERADREQEEARTLAAKAGIPARGEAGSSTYEFAAIRDGRVYVRTTDNVNAAISVGANLVRQTPPYPLSGTGVTVAVWDAGSVLSSHREFTGRLTLRNTVATHSHSTHVGGTIAAAGVTTAAKGMAPNAQLHSYDWNFDTLEMASAGRVTTNDVSKIPVSNHSYGYQAGWYNFGTVWYGTWGYREADGFGMYDAFAADYDEVCYNLPYLLPFKAAGNDRNDNAPSAGSLFTYYDVNGSHTKTYDPETDPLSDRWDNGGYDSLALEGTAKNLLTVGAVEDAVDGEGQRATANAAMTSFSSWGPTDDGRVKPDLVANGASLYSTMSFGDASYGTASGTSMATPSAMGAATLILEHFARLFPGQMMRASTLKGLLIHTADDIGNPGPDYIFGWGLMDTLAAVQHLDAHHAFPPVHRVVEDALSAPGVTNRYVVIRAPGEVLKATLCWTDPPGVAHTNLDDRTPVLVHDLDLRILGPTGEIARAFVLDVEHPDVPATTGDNDVDNVEQVVVASPALDGLYTIEVTLDGALTQPTQVYSLLIGGATQPPQITHTPLLNTTNASRPYPVEASIASEAVVDTNQTAVWWTTLGAAGPYTPAPLVNTSGTTYRAEIPPQPVGTAIHYYLEAAATNGLVGHSPAGAPATVHTFAVVRSYMLFIGGTPTPIPGVDPPYGYSLYPSGITVNASAPLYSEPSNGVRQRCVGWIACCGLPPAGTTNTVSFTLDNDGFLNWLWSPAYELTQSATIPDLIADSSWWTSGSTGSTLLAEERVTDFTGGTNYAFVYWAVDGVRMPDATNRASNPAREFMMTAPRAAVAHYRPVAQDADGNGLGDWWELYYFGATGVAFNVDADGDGFTNLKEYQDRTDPRAAGSYPTPPAIAHMPLAQNQRLPAPWPISAVVTDNDAVASVTLSWQRNGGAWQQAACAPAATVGVYTSTIPAPAITGDTLLYRLTAFDASGLQSVSGAYTIHVAYPVATATPASLGHIEQPSASSDRVALQIGNAGHENLDWTLRATTAGLWETLEDGRSNGWTHGGTIDQWHLASWRAYSGSNAWYFGSDITRQYADRAKAWLMSPPLFIETGATFSFRQWLRTEAVKDATYAWDGGLVELSTNGGTSFEPLAPVGGYPYEVWGHSASAFPSNTPCFAGTGGWEQVIFDLGAYTGQTVRVRLHFGADGYVVNEGWYVDDLRVDPYGGAVDWVTIPVTNGTLASAGTSSMLVNATTQPLAPAETRRAILFLESNDPLRPQVGVPLSLHNLTRRIDVIHTGDGAVFPAGPIFLTRGESQPFALVAGDYHFILDAQGSGLATGLVFGMTHTNVLWQSAGSTNNGVLQAFFSPALTTNGVALWWLAEYGLTNAAPEAEAESDQDGDQMPARAEYIAGTDPTNALSQLNVAAMVAITTSTGGLTVTRVTDHRLEWDSVSGRLYTVWTGTNLLGPFTPVASVTAAPPRNASSQPANAGPRFYRLEVQWPTP